MKICSAVQDIIIREELVEDQIVLRWYKLHFLRLKLFAYLDLNFNENCLKTDNFAYSFACVLHQIDEKFVA